MLPILRRSKHPLQCYGQHVAWLSTTRVASASITPPVVNAAAPAAAATAYDDGLRKVLSHILDDIKEAGTWKKEFNITTKQAAEIGTRRGVANDGCSAHESHNNHRCARQDNPSAQLLYVVLTAGCPSMHTIHTHTHTLSTGANNYLGLSSHPAVIEAAHKSLDTHGFGLSSVRFICGTQVCVVVDDAPLSTPTTPLSPCTTPCPGHSQAARGENQSIS